MAMLALQESAGIDEHDDDDPEAQRSDAEAASTMLAPSNVASHMRPDLHPSQAAAQYVTDGRESVPADVLKEALVYLDYSNASYYIEACPAVMPEGHVPSLMPKSTGACGCVPLAKCIYLPARCNQACETWLSCIGCGIVIQDKCRTGDATAQPQALNTATIIICRSSLHARSLARNRPVQACRV